MAIERRLLVLASKPEGMSPSQRYRFEQWAPRLARDHGIHLDFAPFESAELSELLYRPGRIVRKGLLTLRDYARRAGVLARAKDYDAIVIHREAALIGPAIYERLLARGGTPIIYDFDDAIWSSAQAWKNGWFSRLHFPRKTAAICRVADAVTVGNDYLSAYARQFSKAVAIVPSSIELLDYPALPEAAGDKFVISWTGSVSTLVHFEHARPMLERLAARLPISVKVICSQPPARPIAGAENCFVPWSPDREAADVADCHAGIMPLPDDEVSSGKGAMKALQYMATGRPVVVSAVGINREIVRTGHNGFAVTSGDDWHGALLALANDPRLRATLGGHARATVEQGFSAERSAAKFAAVAAALVGQRRSDGAASVQRDE